MNKQEAVKILRNNVAEWGCAPADEYPIFTDELGHACNLAISALTQQLNDGWVPVSERLPEENGTYIVTQAAHSLRDYDKVLRLDTVCVDFSNGTWRRAKHLEVIAWQPLPEPYKGE